LIAAAIFPTPALAASPIGGRWITADRAAVVEVGRCGATMCGRVQRILARSPGGATQDVNNPSPALRRRPLLGLPILTEFVEDGDSWRGRIYDPRRGKTYKSAVARQADGSLKVQGCIAFFCQTQIWTRAS
jgi:uncharacterized protein (DUF2147 family)